MVLADITRANQAAAYMPIFKTKFNGNEYGNQQPKPVDGIGSVDGGVSSAKITGSNSRVQGIDTTSRMDAIDKNVIVPKMKSDELGQKLELFA